MGQSRQRNIVVLGSTGAVGTQALEVVRRAPDKFRIVGLAARSRWDVLARQAEEFRPEAVALIDSEAAERLASSLNGLATQVLVGPVGLEELASWPDADVVLSAVSGGAGLPAAMAAVRSGKTLALANKEAIVMCGPLLEAAARRTGATILPVDSEHSAIFQLLRGVSRDEVARVILTASGGPFYGLSPRELEKVRPEDAVRHPTWRMGPKISVDSATLMNKGLEVVEARWLFGLPAERIGVLIHPQCVIHCLVELVDGSVLAHMGVPDMRPTIQYAFSYPERVDGVAPRLDLTRLSGLQLRPPREGEFPALELGYRAAREGGTCGAVLSAANEVAVEAFLAGRIRFTQIVDLVRRVLDEHVVQEDPTLEAIMAVGDWARKEAERCLVSS